MRENFKKFFGISATMLLWACANAIVPDPAGHRYDGIAPSNIFHLKEPPLQNPITHVLPQLQTVKLMGITTILGYKLALLKTRPPLKTGEQPREQTLMLTEGQGDGDIEVLEIDERAGRVKLSNSGTIMTLNFEKDGVKQPPPLPTTPPNPAAAVPVPTAAGITPTPSNPSIPSNVVYPGKKVIPSRFGAPAPAPAPSAASTNALPLPAGKALPLVPVPAQASPPPAQMTPDEQAVITELERAISARTNTSQMQQILNTPASVPSATSPPPAQVIAPQ